MKKPKAKVSTLKSDHFFYLVATALLVVFVLWMVDLGRLHHYGQSGQSKSESINDQNLYKSLNLSDVRKATFNSQQIKRVKDLGSESKIHKYVFSFGVPADNLTEKGLLTLPTTPQPPGGYPVLILCHGYSAPWYYSTAKAYLPDMSFYSQHGFAVLKPDFRGQGLSIPDGDPEGAYYSMAYNTDTMSLIAAIKKTSYLDSGNINIWGHSMGAYIALRAAAVSPDIKRAILLAGPVGYISDMYSSYVAISDTLNPVAANIRLSQLDQHGTPISNPNFWKGVSPINYLSDTKTFFQIHVGSNDKTVPPRLSADLDQALSKINKKHQYFVYPDGGHGLGPERSLIYPRSLELLQSKNST